MLDKHGMELGLEAEKRFLYLGEVQHQMWLHHISGKALTRALGHGANFASRILRGDYPWPRAYQWPLDFEQYVYEHLRVRPPVIVQDAQEGPGGS